MQVSMSTGCLYHLPPDQIAAAAVESGFQHVEVLLNRELMDDIGPMARALEAHGLQATVAHAPFYLDGLISAPGRQADAVAVGTLAFDAARAAGAPALSLHPGTVPRFGGVAQDYVDTAVGNLETLRALAQERDMELLVENTSAAYILGVKVSGQLGNEPEEMDAFLGPSDAPRLRMTFDTSHASTIRKVPVDTFIRAMGARIASLHLSDSNGLIDHLPIGVGKINFTRVFDALRAIAFNGNATLEFRPKHSTPTELRRNRVLVETELQPR